MSDSYEIRLTGEGHENAEIIAQSAILAILLAVRELNYLLSAEEFTDQDVINCVSNLEGWLLSMQGDGLIIVDPKEYLN